MNKKIFFLGALKSQTSDGSVGGTYVASSSLAEYLLQSGYDIIPLNTTYKINSVGSKISTFKKFKTILIRNLGFLFKVASNRKAKTILIFVSAGNSYMEKIPIIFISRICRKKIILLPRSGFVQLDYKKKFYRKIVDYVNNKSDFIICQSQHWKTFFLNNGINCSKLLVIENWYPTEQLKISRKMSSPKYSRGSFFKIIFIGRIEKGKGIDDLISFAENYSGFHSFKIDIYGAGTYEEVLKKKVEEKKLNNIIQFKGWLNSDKKLHTINKYQIGVFTSRFEGYPNSLLDYIFAKVPILTTDLNSIKAVGSDFLTYYTPGDINSFHHAYNDIINNYNLKVENAQRLYEEKYEQNNIEIVGKKLIELIT